MVAAAPIHATGGRAAIRPIIIIVTIIIRCRGYREGGRGVAGADEE
jgi:hypothetical protein